MAAPVRVPPASISMEEVTIVEWLVADGARVTAGQPIVEIETDKSTIEVDAPRDGVLRQLAPTGAAVAVDALLAEVADPDEAATSPAPGTSAAEASETSASAAPAEGAPTAAPAPAEGGSVRATPAARSLAARLGVDLRATVGTGPDGQVTAADVQRTETDSGAHTDARAATVRAITASWHTVPHIHIGGELDADGIVACRLTFQESPRPSVTDLLVFALVRALAEVPELNAIVQRDGSVKQADSVDCVIATATPQGIVAPVIRKAETMTLAAISETRARVVAAARAHRLEADARGPGTITLSNLGMYPVDFFVPVINSPQVALIATGRVRGDSSSGHRMWTNVAIDHRAADGEAGGRFLAAFERALAALPKAPTESRKR
jgi:pyruvate dehydrogenase E2 component (dihydrolipoamide acetyltransferase)